jgi:hypothetical protein
VAGQITCPAGMRRVANDNDNRETLIKYETSIGEPTATLSAFADLIREFPSPQSDNLTDRSALNCQRSRENSTSTM